MIFNIEFFNCIMDEILIVEMYFYLNDEIN